MAQLQKAPWSDWETVRLIGRGSFGTVYEIRRNLVDGETETAALKVITIPQNPGDIEELYSEGYDDESVTATFNAHLKSIIAEYSLMRKMEGSANVVNCKDIRYIQHDDGIGWDIYIRMELLTPLIKALPAEASEADVVALGKDICSALVLCKKHGIVHRDIKPQNIFISPNGDYKLGDFGIAKTVEKTMGGTKIGTYKYMAPEVYNNQPYGSAADIYSLGLVLYWLLNYRRMPFMPLPPAKLTALQDEDARHRRLSGEKLPAPARGSEALKQIVMKACAYDPEDRYGSAAAMLQDLNRLECGAATGMAATVIFGETDQDDKTDVYSGGNVQLCPEDGTVSVYEAEGTAALPEEEGTAVPPNEEGTVIIYEEAAAAVLPEEEGTAVPTDEEGTVAVYEEEGTAALLEEAGTQLCPEDKTAVMAAAARATAAEEAAQRKAVQQKEENERQWQTYLQEEETKEEKNRTIKTILLCLLPVVALIVLICCLRSCEGAEKGGMAEKPWSEWADSLPQTVSADKYEIEEKTLYSSSTLETTSSTDTDQMPGWELYDTVESDGEYGPWSDWSATKVKASDTKEVETQTRYRYRDKETTTGTSSKKSGWKQYDTTYIYGDYGSWSKWSTSSVKSDENRQVESKTQYRYRSIFKGTEYTAWSAWSAWSATRQSTNDLKKEESRTVWGYYYFKCPGCGAHMHGWDITCPTWAGGCGKKYIPNSSWTEVYSTTSWDNAGLKDWYGTGKYYTYINGELVFKWSSHGASKQYRYATRSTRQVTEYGNWSSWGDTVYSPSSSVDVQSRTVYRYRDRVKEATYYFYRWGDWSEWTENSVTGDDNRQVETKTFYRYREQGTITTNYFRRWTDWSAYGEEAVTETDTRKVQTKTQYRYKAR